MDRPPTTTALWLRIARRSTSPSAAWLLGGVALALCLAGITFLLAVPKLAREQWVFETLLEFLRTHPPADQILQQLPPERLASVRERGQVLVARTLTPAVLALMGFAALAAAAYAWVARLLRSTLELLHVGSIEPEPFKWDRFATFFCVAAALAIAAHVPHATQSIRFDEDVASTYAVSSWWAWANNITGWQNHVASLFTIRLSTALLGLNELSVRLPAILASALGLAALCTHLYRRHSLAVACCTAALVMAVPMWGEQTTLARGYGLSFGAAALFVIGWLRLSDELDQPSNATMACLFAGAFVGSLAHFFFVFFVVGALAVVVSTRELTASTRLCLSWWIALASIIPAISFALGAPAIAVQMGTLPTPGFSVLFERFFDELAFRRHGRWGWALAMCSATNLVAALVTLPARARRPVAIVLAFVFVGPLLANPVYFYPRFFVHALAIVAPCVAWLISVRICRSRLSLSLVVVAMLFALWGRTGWSALPYVDQRRAAALARAESQRIGSRFAVDITLASGARFYNGTAGRIANISHPIPQDVERILFAVDHSSAQTMPTGFATVERLPGNDYDVILATRSVVTH